MKNYFFTTILVFYFIGGIAQSTTDETVIRELNASFDEAIKNADVSFFEKVLADDYVSFGPDGTKKTRSQVLEEVEKQKSTPSYRITNLGSDDVQVRVSDNLAVVTAKWNATTESMEEGDSHSDVGHYVSVYEKRDGQWKLVTEMVSEKPHTPEELEPSLRDASMQYEEAITNRDSIAFSKLLADDYTSTSPEGSVRSKEQDIAYMFDPDVTLESISTEDKKFRVYKNFAIETGKYHVAGTYKGEKFSDSGRYTSTWIYQDGKWKLIADHTSTVQPEQ